MPYPQARGGRVNNQSALAQSEAIQSLHLLPHIDVPYFTSGPVYAWSLAGGACFSRHNRPPSEPPAPIPSL